MGRAAILLAFLTWHTVVDRDEIRFQSWFGLSRSTYPYSAVKDIRTSSQFRTGNGDLIQRREWIIEFTDGAHWRTSLNIFDLTEATKDAVAKFVSQQSGKSIRELEVLE